MRTSSPAKEGETVHLINLHNRRVVEARKLYQRKYRERQRRFLVEGLQSLHMALDRGLQPDEVFWCEERLIGHKARCLLTRCEQMGVSTLRVSPDVLETLSERDSPQGIVAVFALFECALAALHFRGNELVIVADRLQDPGNLGTLIRTSDAVGARAVILVEPCADPFDPKTVRASMGSLFNVPLARTTDVMGLLMQLRRSGLRLVGADVHRGTAWERSLWAGGVALILGNEARGLSPDLAREVQAWARLPMMGKAESLNVAAAGAVLMYEWLRTNLHGRN